MVKVAILGYGVVGSGVYEVIRRAEKSEIEVVAILDVKPFPEHENQALFKKSFDEILYDDSINVVVECIGGLHPAYDYSKQALKYGKNVITSNKEVVAEYGNKLSTLAKNQGVKYLYEASVGGGIPIIRPLNQCLAGEKISEIYGILNGTTNYILTSMEKNSVSFDEALKEAQEKGYAEQDPTNDIEGYDTKRKIKILAQLAFGEDIPMSEISTQGITNIDINDIKQAQEAGCALKLIGYAKRLTDGRVECHVRPMAIPKSNPLYGVEDVFNGVRVVAEPIGEVMFYGRGAGKFPTASAVLSDILEVAREVS